MTNMNEEISKIIDKALPAELSHRLKSHLEEAEKNKEIIEFMTKDIEAFKKDLEWREKELDKLRFLNLEEEGIKRRSEELRIRRSEVELERAKYQLESERETNSKIMELVKIVFKNPILTYGTSYSENGNNNQGMYTSKNISHTITQEVIK